MTRPFSVRILTSLLVSEVKKESSARANLPAVTLGSSRDFFFRRKAPAGVEIKPSSNPSGTKGSGPAATRPTEKFLLEDGDLLLMRGRTQAEWEHAVPRRKHAGGRINITFRRVMNRKGTESEWEGGEGQVLRHSQADGWCACRFPSLQSWRRPSLSLS